METISNVVNTVSTTATKAIWGEQKNETAGNEPVSGVQGKGTTTDPYDAGNADPSDSTTRDETNGQEPVSGLEGKGTATEPFDQGNSGDTTNTTSLPIREKSSSIETSAADASIDSAGVAGTKNLSDTLSKTEGDVQQETVPAEGEVPLAGFANDRKIDPDDKTKSSTETSATAGDAVPSSSSDIQSGGLGDTKNLPTTSTATTPMSPFTTGNEGGAALGSAKETSDQHVESTGSAADASKPGTAKEADRLLEEKEAKKASKKEGSPSGDKEKVSKMEKLKEKLHIGHKH